ncbi:MAG: hypothetical protein Tsb0014_05470 [Pleurocapsa sp.]
MVAFLDIDRTETTSARILIVDDTPDNLDLLSSILHKQGYETRRAISGEIALQIAQSGWAELILLDIQMPEMDGYEVCEKLKADPKTHDIPVIFISALDGVLDKKKAFKLGGVDYITKPFQIKEVVARVANQITIYTARQKIIHLNNQLEKKVQERTIELETANQKLKQEIQQRQQAQDRLLKMALKDSITGLANRNALIGNLKKVLQLTKQKPNYFFAVILLECERFKTIKRSLSHIESNQLLMAIGNAIASCLPESALLVRLEGEEFAVLLDKINDENEVINIVKKIQEKFSSPFRQQRRKFLINTNFGIVIGNQDYQETDRILNDADIALQKTKEQGGERYQVFQPEMYLQLQLDADFANQEVEIKQAIKCQEFKNYYLPIVCLNTQKVVELEALVRWQHPRQGLILPQDFIAIAEETGLIIAIGDLVLKQGCHQIKYWQKKYQLQDHLSICLNLSAKQLFHPNLIPKIDLILRKTEINGSCIQLEIAENTIIENPELTEEILQKLKKRQIKLSLDNFGTGYSSLTHLHHYPFDNLKIDRSLVSKIDQEQTHSDLILIEQIITIAHQMNMIVTATGIETQEQLERLKNLGCDRGQGYLISQVLDRDSVKEFLTSNG